MFETQLYIKSCYERGSRFKDVQLESLNFRLLAQFLDQVLGRLVFTERDGVL